MTPSLAIAESDLLHHFPHEPFVARHPLVGHPAFTLERLVDLAATLPADSVEYNAGELDVGVFGAETPRNGLSPTETIRRIETCRSWLVLKNVEQDPEFAALLDALLDDLERRARLKLHGFGRREGFVFVSSPGSVTPYHLDPEHNFLLQLRGTKTIHMFDVADRFVMSEAVLDASHVGSGRNLPYAPTYEAHARCFTLTPGDALHFPVNAPHWVQNGDAVSISFSVTFRSAQSERNSQLRIVNHHLRQLGLAPSPVGRRPLVDDLKYVGFHALRRAKHLVRGRET